MGGISLGFSKGKDEGPSFCCTVNASLELYLLPATSVSGDDVAFSSARAEARFSAVLSTRLMVIGSATF